MTKPSQPIVIHHIEGRRGERVAWLCEELGLPYELRFLQGDILGSIEALEQAHVMRMTPTVEDGSLKMVESGAILEYLLLRYGDGQLRPATDAPEMADYLQWLHFAEGSGMFRAMIERMILQLTGGKPPPELAYIYIGGSRRVLAFAEAALSRSPYFAGSEFSAADIMMHFPLRLAGLAVTEHPDLRAVFSDTRQGLGDYPAINAFLDRIVARPAFQRAMKSTMPAGPPPM